MASGHAARSVYVQDPRELSAADDVHFQLPVKVLQSNGVRLEPFVPSLHAREFWSLAEAESGLAVYRYLPYGPFKSLEEYLTFIETLRQDSSVWLWAIRDLCDGGRLAGTVALLNTSAPNLLTEIGHLAIFPHAQRTHIATHANCLLLKYCLDELKLRRVEWRCHADNGPSNAAALRLGFKPEGTIRWHRVLGQSKVGPRPHAEALPGRHTNLLAICWDDWENGVKAHVETLLAREIVPRAPRTA